jgi:serine/threonine-protein kinase
LPKISAIHSYCNVVTLTLLDPKNKAPIRQWLFTASRKINVGRSADNHVVLQDILVSRHHLELHLIHKGEGSGIWLLKSLGSNGTFLDGQRTNQAKLTHTHILQLGLTGPILRWQQKFPDQHQPEHQVEPAALAEGKSCQHPGNSPDNLFCIHCGQPLRILQTLGSYQVLKVLGIGGMGTTFLVRPKHGCDRQAPLQVLKEMNADMQAIPKAQELFKREARMLRSLNHPGIPHLYDYFTENTKEYLVMELIHGQNLDQWVNQRGPLAPTQAIPWMIQACDILTYIHCHNPPIIHRDLKPSNMLIRHRDGQLFIIDFGAVKEASLVPGTRIAVEGYSAPEQGWGRPTIQSDLYGLGATLIFLLTGRSPQQFYKNLGYGHRIQLTNAVSIPADVKAIIERVTDPQAEHRFASASALAKALQDCL